MSSVLLYFAQQHVVAFVCVILGQFIFFVAHATLSGQRHLIWGYLWRGLLAGLPFGLAFDLIVGNYVGIQSYTFGYTPFFLVCNGILSYGIMMANVLLLRKSSWLHIYVWSVALGMVYEAINFICPVWEWTFGTPLREYMTVIFVAYAGLTWLMMLSLHRISGVSFKVLERGYYKDFRLW
jgi:hypothetical protein